MSGFDRVDPVSSDTGSTTSAASSSASSSAGDGAAAPKRKQRWGLRTLGFLTIVVTALLVAREQGHHTLGTLGCVVLGTGAAFYCSVRGVRDMLGLEWYRRRLDSRPTDEV